MRKLTTNFNLSEFVLNKFAKNQAEQQRVIDSLTEDIEKSIEELAKNLQVLRDELGARITVNIGFRPKWWELLRGRSGKSQHACGKAADIVVNGFTPAQVANTIERLIAEGRMKQGGLKAYNTFVHYDIRGVRARW
ncbi:YcbK family protein [Mongoliitalea lutea]|uniref:Peptidase M15A C-terminal domain-containing protein n=1 Tax=Mongoliitalea lutea TaxID=849756 RepID=A0A8J3G6A9_9BACT|nr:D-Ala-D-Ala carboxypeptidase family metallohydrolase [Mongoliitalea lutea]GHB44325.1 hypothetical protein GCM10008106_26710 [Mongoliitalea lutea]